MANEHIGRLEKIGIGKESVAGTPVAASKWIPKSEGSFSPEIEKARDDSAYGTIDELRESVVSKQKTAVTMKGMVRDILAGDLLLATFGTETLCVVLNISGGAGTLVAGENVTGGTSGAVGLVKRVFSTYILITVTSGTFSAETITGSISGATRTITLAGAMRVHFFQRANTNNHPSYTIIGVDDCGTYRSAYGMMEQLELELNANGFLSFNSTWKGKKEETTTATPAFSTTENSFQGKHANLYFADTLAGLDAAAATPVSSLKITIPKDLVDYQAFGSVDIASQHNRKFRVFGEFTAIFNSTTIKDYLLANTKKSMRIKIANTDVTIGTAKNPMIQIDMAKVAFESWSKEGGNNDLIMQKIGFEMEFSVSDAEGIVAFLANSQITAY